MTSELDELALRVEKDESLGNTDLDGVIASVVEKTCRDWAAMSGQYLMPDALIGVGIGYAALTRDGETVYEEDGQHQRDLMTVAQAERLAQREPERDWRIHLVAQLEDRHYRREGAGLWVLYERGYGMS
jgi:hypothetical protein